MTLTMEIFIDKWIYLIYIILYKSQIHEYNCLIPFTEQSKEDLKSCDRHQNSNYFLVGNWGILFLVLVIVYCSSLLGGGYRDMVT